MGFAQATTVINAPVDLVWNSLNDIEHTPEWGVGLEKAEVKQSAARFGVGTVYIDYNRLGPQRQVTSWRIAVYEPMRRQVHVSSSATLPSTMTLLLTPEEGGTRLQMTVAYRFMPRLGVVSRLLERLVMNRVLSSIVRQNQQNLNTYLSQRSVVRERVA